MSNSVTHPPASPVGSSARTSSGWSRRQAKTIAKLCDAAVIEVRRCGYEGLTVRNVAATAGVAPATAYLYFSSKDHLIAEVFWRRLDSADSVKGPGAADATGAVPEGSVRDGLDRALRALSLLVADEPELATACSIAMLGTDPEVRELRDRIGAEMYRRIIVALGPVADPAVGRALNLLMSGALLHAGMGHLDYTDLPDRLAEASALILGDAP